MLSKEENEFLTRVGPGTAMGDLVRRSWIPVLLSSELPGPDCDPVRFQLLGEKYVAFRDSAGNVGFLDEACPHRGASLALGRCEGGGLRCLYHGWKFDTEGTIIETPNLREGASFRSRIKARSFPCVEAAEIIWVYVGPADLEPPLPNYVFMDAASEHLAPMRVEMEANWVQVMEGHHDSAHASLLHFDYSPFRPDTSDDYLTFLKQDAELLSDDDSPTIEVEDTEFGFYAGALRDAVVDGSDVTFARIHVHIAPFLNIVPPNLYMFDVPMTDTRTSVITLVYDPGVVVDRQAAGELMGSGAHSDAPYFDGNHFTGSAENNWGQDRSKMDRSFTGIGHLAAEDWAVVVSMGGVIDRTKERLVASDAAVTRLRRQLLKAARALQQNDIEPPVVRADLSAVRALQATLKSGEDWRDVVMPDRHDATPADAGTTS
ncbi:Rieske 2Fe-2S domain-containing protein [Pseudonocardia ailaonensis]|uniref:Rieske 2Fe-2S domain-containing protein n=1 Tax=Pseudonocardia ailaonensis TaxID=367279 RepID=A0ABN2NJR4_9PSEU